MKYFNDYFQHTPTDDFGHSEQWNREADKWLEFIYQIDPKFYELNKNRVLSNKQRDEFLGEAKTIYFFGRILGLEIVEIEPTGKGNTKLDLSIKDLNGDLWKIEVKSPSWLGQLWKDPNLSEAQKKDRASKPKYINGEGGSFSAEEEIAYAAEDSIKNALPKFTKDEKNLLVVVPDMHHQIITMLGISAMAGGSKIIQAELLGQDPQELIKTVLVLEPFLYSGDANLTYAHKFIPITEKPLLPATAELI